MTTAAMNGGAAGASTAPSPLRAELVETLFSLVRIPSESGNEREFLSHVESLLGREFGAACRYDAFGNLVATLPAKASAATEALLFGMHADTVAPGTGIKPLFDGEAVRTDGSTVLGADDKAGIAELLVALRHAPRHPPLELVFTREEEKGLIGSRNLDYSLLTARRGYVLDMDAMDAVVIGCPTKINLDIQITGRAAHAGMEPEKGVSAIRVAALAIADLPEGRIDPETTCNVGRFSGGENRNSLAEKANLVIEVRSLVDARAVALASRYRAAFESRAAEAGASIHIEESTAYRAAVMDPEDPTVTAAREALLACGIKPDVKTIVGGTDASAYNEHGISCAVLGVGARQEHTRDEYVLVSDMELGVRIITNLMERFA